MFLKESYDYSTELSKIRARLPKGKGVWPAIWMLLTDKPPTVDGQTAGEIDIMEHVGYIPTVPWQSSTRNYNGMIGTQVVQSHYMNDVTEKFHEYGFPDTGTNRFLIDDTVFHRFKNDGRGYKSSGL
ncbi:MAG: family 16 glycosylhydrolase [Saprospiraceae bacterium]